MCWAQAVAAAVAIVGAYAEDTQKNKETKAAEKRLNEQNAVRADEINQKYGNELNERAKAARRERAAMRVATAESGVNLGSNSFLAQLQASEANEDQNNGLILKNKNNEQRARQTQYSGQLSQLQYITTLGKAVHGHNAGAAAFMGSGGMTAAAG